MFHTPRRMKCKQMESNTRKLGRKKGFLCQIIKRKVLAGQSDWASERRARAAIKEGANICLSLLISRTGWDTKQLMASVEISYLRLRLHSHRDPAQKGHRFCSRRQTLPLFSLISTMMKHSFSTLHPIACSFILPINHEPPSVWVNPGQSSIRYLCECSALFMFSVLFNFRQWKHW